MSAQNPVKLTGDDNAGAFALGEWTVEPGALLLCFRAQCERIEPRAMRVLCALAAHTGETVSREELMNRVWGHTHLTDEALTKIVSRLRRLFVAGGGVQIETIPRVGYRLLVDVNARASAPARRRAREFAAGVAVVMASAAAALYAAYVPVQPDAWNEARLLPLTTLPGHERQVTFSPDGSQFAFARREHPDTDWDVFVGSVNGDGLRPLTESAADERRPLWSPDGRWVAYLARDEGRCEVRLVSPIGGVPRRLTACEPEGGDALAWTPDAGALVMMPPGARGLSLFSLENGTVSALTAPEETFLDDMPVLSPDGEWLAFVRWRAHGVGDIHVTSLRTRASRRLTFDSQNVRGLSWTPDGAHVLHSSNRAGGQGLWRVSREGGDLRRVAAPSYSMEAPALSGDGRRLAYEEWRAHTNIFAFRPGESMAVPVTDATRWDWDPQPSPDGAHVAFVSDRTGAPELWVARTGSSEATRLTALGGPHIGSPSWSADGRWLVFDVPLEDGNFDIYRVSVDGGTARRLTRHPAHDRFAHVSPDGAYVYFSSRRSGEWQIWRIASEGGEPEQITRNGAYFSRMDDAGRLYFSRQDRPGLWMTNDGQDETLLLEDLRTLDCTNWALTGNSVWYVRRDATKPELIRFNTGKRREENAFSLAPHGYQSGLGVDTAGNIYFSRLISSEVDLLMLERAP